MVGAARANGGSCASERGRSEARLASPPLLTSPLPSCLQLELERKIRTLLSKEKEKAEEEAALAMGLCTGGAMLP